MLPNIGNLSLIFIMLCSALTAVMPFFKISYSLKRITEITSAIIFVLTFTALGVLVLCFAKSDFSVLLVANHSHQINPLIFKISAAWGNHEGSMLLWLLCMASYQMIYSFLGISTNKEKIISNSIQSFMILMFTAFVVIASNPFTRIFPAPNQGLGFNPILQDIGLAMHPPILYLGYVGSSMVFSIITAAMIRGVITVEVIKDLRLLTKIFWVFLTLGISLGSWWAYRELGWGGYWFWDPVENASLMPWISATALFHSILAADKSQHMKVWIIILALITFLLSVMGTFLVRSGLLTSVHSFAVDAERGIFILGMFAAMTFGAFGVFAVRAGKFSSDESIYLTTKTGMILIQNIILNFMLFVVFIATLYPLFSSSIGKESATIGVGYYNFFNKITALLLVLFCILGHVSKWSKTNLKETLLNHKFSILLAFLIAANFLFIYEVKDIYLVVLILISAILVVLSFKGLISRLKSFKITQISSHVAHLGFALLVISIALNQFLQFDVQQITKLNHQLEAGQYKLHYKSVDHFMMDNYLARQATIDVYKDGVFLGNVKPQLRLYTIEQQTTVEAAILTNNLTDIYVVIGDMNDDQSLNITCYIRPFVKLIWFSCFLLLLGGVTSIVRLTSSRINGRKLLS